MYFTKEGIDYHDNLDGTYILNEDLVLVTSDWHTIIVPLNFKQTDRVWISWR